MKKLTLFLYLIISSMLFSTDLKKEEIVVQWSKFESSNLTLTNKSLTATIPEFLYENFPDDLKHYPDTNQSDLIYNSLKKAEIKKLEKERRDLLAKKDELFFKKGSTKEEKEKIEKEIEDKNLELETAKSIDIKTFKVITELPITFKPENSEDFNIIEEEKLDNYLKVNSVDYYIYGYIEEVDSELFVKVFLYSKYRSEPEVVWKGIGNNEEIVSYRDDILDSLIRKITTDDIIKYSVEANPDDSLIYINDDFKSLGFYSGYALNSDILKIDISKEGYNSLSIENELSDTNLEFKFDLIESSKNYVNITSSPPGAAAYYGSKYIGETPIDVPVYSYPLKLTLSLDGYLDKSLIINSKIKETNVVFDKEYFDTEEYFRKEKEKFYFSTAIFSISLALPLYFTAQHDTLLSSGVDVSRLQVINYISIGNAVIWGIHLFYRLYRYLEAAKLSVN